MCPSNMCWTDCKWIWSYYLKHSGVNHIIINIVRQADTEYIVFKYCKFIYILASETQQG
jgi:hypothetical protein